MKHYFKKELLNLLGKENLVMNRNFTTTGSAKRLRLLGPKIWNSLPEKTAITPYKLFKPCLFLK